MTKHISPAKGRSSANNTLLPFSDIWNIETTNKYNQSDDVIRINYISIESTAVEEKWTRLKSDNRLVKCYNLIEVAVEEFPPRYPFTDVQTKDLITPISWIVRNWHASTKWTHWIWKHLTILTFFLYYDMPLNRLKSKPMKNKSSFLAIAYLNGVTIVLLLVMWQLFVDY